MISYSTLVIHHTEAHLFKTKQIQIGKLFYVSFSEKLPLE